MITCTHVVIHRYQKFYIIIVIWNIDNIAHHYRLLIDEPAHNNSLYIHKRHYMRHWLCLISVVCDHPQYQVVIVHMIKTQSMVLSTQTKPGRHFTAG